jgi:hypothetical protein
MLPIKGSQLRAVRPALPKKVSFPAIISVATEFNGHVNVHSHGSGLSDALKAGGWRESLLLPSAAVSHGAGYAGTIRMKRRIS